MSAPTRPQAGSLLIAGAVRTAGPHYEAAYGMVRADSPEPTGSFRFPDRGRPS
jgi:hypothetical protein